MKKLRSMSLKDKILLSIVIAVGLAVLCLLFVLPLLPLSEAQRDVMMQIIIIVCLALLVLYIVCFFAFYAKDGAVEKAAKYALRYDSFPLLRNGITEKLHALCFLHLATVQRPDGATLELLLKEQGAGYTCVAFLRQTVVQEASITWAEQEITAALQSHFKKQILREKISLLLFICVDRVSPTFYKIVDGGAEQSFKTFRLPVGISFGGKKIYVPHLKGSWGEREYRLLLQSFTELLDWPEACM